MRNAWFGAGLALAVLLTGCGQPIEKTPDPAGEGASVPSAITGGTTVAVTLKEWSITLEPASIKAGATTLKIANVGSEPHGVFVEGPGVDRKGPLVPPGGTGELSLDFPAGEYTLFDFVKDNETARDMRATLTVE